jgi:murein DD-endopeptidase MepM/ murein hydrolase activator NlpD
LEKGEPIRSIKEGIVRIHDYGSGNAGKTVFVNWEDGKTAIYGHLNDFLVKNGQHVLPGDLLGHSGIQDSQTGSHFHFGVIEGGKFIDHFPYIDQIQTMNVKQFVQHIAEPVPVKVSFFDFMNQHINALAYLKLYLISLLSEHIAFVLNLITGIF